MSRGTPIRTILVIEEDDGTGRGFMLRKYISLKIDYDASVDHDPYYWEQSDLRSSTKRWFPDLTDAVYDAWDYFGCRHGYSVLGWLDPDYVIDTDALLKKLI